MFMLNIVRSGYATRTYEIHYGSIPRCLRCCLGTTLLCCHHVVMSTRHHVDITLIFHTLLFALYKRHTCAFVNRVEKVDHCEPELHYSAQLSAQQVMGPQA
jgi:hypothetical protein